MCIEVSITPYKGWENCVRIANRIVELFVTTDVGPRIIHFGYLGGENVFAVFPETEGRAGGDEWCSFGGHRLWHAPEDPQRTYAPDNDAVGYEEMGTFVRFRPVIEDSTRIQKEIDVYLDPDKAEVRLVQRITNHNLWAVRLSVWGLSVMAAGGVGILPLPPRGSHPENLLPTSNLVMWAYTDMADPRWTWGTKYILLRQDAKAESVQKIGSNGSEGWAAYQRNGVTFVKAYTPVKGAEYPDMGCGVEIFTNARMMEIESLGPLTEIAPGESIEHEERWRLVDNHPPITSENDILESLLPG